MTKFKTKTDALLDDLLQDCESPEASLGEHGLLKGVTKRLIERALQAELTTYLGYAPHARHQAKSGKFHGIDPARLNLLWAKNANADWRALLTKS